MFGLLKLGNNTAFVPNKDTDLPPLELARLITNFQRLSHAIFDSGHFRQ